MISDTLPALLAQRLNLVAPALIERGHAVSFRRLSEQSRRVAHGLKTLGVQPGERVALWLPNVAAWLATFFGCAQLGKAAISYATLAAAVPLLESDAAPHAGCAIFTTSGTTKAPKFVLHDQRTVLAHARDVVKGFDIGRDAVMLLAPPLCGVFGFCSAMATLAAGRPLIIAPAWDAERMLAGGRPASPAEIKAVVQEAPGIAACQVVGVPRAASPVPVAFVVLHHSAAFEEAAVIAYVAARLARYKVPLRVLPIDAFPVTPDANATKLQKGRLRELAEALLH